MVTYDYDAFEAHKKKFFQDMEASRQLEIHNHALELETFKAQLRIASEEASKNKAEVERLNKIIEQMNNPWVSVYSTKFEVNDGWTLRNERQNNDASRNLPKNAVFGNGLTILGLRETVGTGDSKRDFTTADVLGQHVAVGNYFRARMIARAPHAKGIWPCPLWFRPANHSDGEIDIMENFGGQPRAKATLHTAYANRKMHGTVLPWPKAPDAYYEYIIEKTPNRILITMDGHVLMDASPSKVPADFDWAGIFEKTDKTWYPRITLQIGCGVDNPNCETGFPDPTFQKTDMHIKELQLWNYAP